MGTLYLLGLYPFTAASLLRNPHHQHQYTVVVLHHYWYWRSSLCFWWLLISTSGAKTCGPFRTIPFWYVLPSVTLCVPFGKYDFILVIHGLLGYDRHCGFSPIFYHGCPKCHSRIQGYRIDHRELYRFCHHHYQHTTFKLPHPTFGNYLGFCDIGFRTHIWSLPPFFKKVRLICTFKSICKINLSAAGRSKSSIINEDKNCCPSNLPFYCFGVCSKSSTRRRPVYGSRTPREYC